MTDKPSDIKLAHVLPAIDRKDKEWWETLNPEQKAKFPSWLYMRYASTVDSNADFARYYLMAVNETVNKHFNSVKHHPKLQYLLMAAASPGLGTQRHSWLSPGKKGKANKKINLLSKLYPNANDDELELLSNINNNEDIIQELESRGWTSKDIAVAMKGVDE